MDNLLLVLFIINDLLFYIIIIDIILSWLNLIGLNFKIDFIRSILDPIYEKIKNIIPTNFGPFELAPLILIISLKFIQVVIFQFNPDIILKYNNFLNF